MQQTSKNDLTNIYTLWTTDTWLSNNSFELKGIFSTKAKAIDSAKEKQLLDNESQVVICKGVIDDDQDQSEKVFSTEYEKDRKQLQAVPVI